ncbi:MAG: alpha-1,2-fucosyltransferase [Synechococcus lacustris]|nr:alpha-1,2-fucosyltransferase [Synechococcus lacustris]
MITFSKLGKYGRLGNQLFQYAILIVIREKIGYEIKLHDLSKTVWHGQKNLLNNFNLKYENIEESDKVEFLFEEKKNFDIDVFNIKDNTDLFGYFGDYRYLKGYEDKIIEELTPKNELLIKSKSIIDEIKIKHKNYKIISLHLRRGDTDLSIYDGPIDKSIWGKYFSNAKLKFSNQKCKFLVFTGGSRNEDPKSDYLWCKNNLIGDDFIFIEENSTIFDFCTMLCCDGHILAPTSTLSWWVGFLNKDKCKITVAPKYYKFLKHEPEDGFYPDFFELV